MSKKNKPIYIDLSKIQVAKGPIGKKLKKLFKNGLMRIDNDTAIMSIPNATKTLK